MAQDIGLYFPETCLDNAGLKLVLEKCWTKVPSGWFDFIDTCLDNAGLKLILEKCWTKVDQAVGFDFILKTHVWTIDFKKTWK